MADCSIPVQAGTGRCILFATMDVNPAPQAKILIESAGQIEGVERG
jgi:hypothetical protein